jgi:hypothetical protein
VIVEPYKDPEEDGAATDFSLLPEWFDCGYD